MNDAASTAARRASPEVTRAGLTAALVAYLVWGLLPIYFKLIETVPALEILAHRIVWAIPFGAVILWARRQWSEVRQALGDRRVLSWLFVTAGLIAVNWLVYIVAVQQDQVFQASLGYYINPLINVVVGIALLGERLYRAQLAAVAIASVGVTVLTVSGGQLPWIALTLAVSFMLYGLIRKQISVGAMPGLFIETLILLPLALAYLLWSVTAGDSVFGHAGVAVSLGLLAAGPLTAVPLLFFALAARGMPLSILGIMQFIAPTLQFLVGVAYGEVLTAAHIVCFACIWIAITIFVLDAWYRQRSAAKRHLMETG